MKLLHRKPQPDALIPGFHRTTEHVKAVIDKGGDAAFPPPGGKYPLGTKVGAFYIGGDTVHIWTVTEVNRMASGVDYLLPIFVRSNPIDATQGTVDGMLAGGTLLALGAPSRCAVTLDLETARNPVYVEAFKRAVAPHTAVEYGSTSTLFFNPGPYWIAEPGIGLPDPRGVGTQFAFDGEYDLTWWRASYVTAHMWPTHRRHGPFKHVAVAGETLMSIATHRHTTVGHLIGALLKSGTDAQIASVVMAGLSRNLDPEMLDKLAVYVRDLPLKPGTVYYTSNP